MLIYVDIQRSRCVSSVCHLFKLRSVNSLFVYTCDATILNKNGARNVIVIVTMIIIIMIILLMISIIIKNNDNINNNNNDNDNNNYKKGK